MRLLRSLTLTLPLALLLCAACSRGGARRRRHHARLGLRGRARQPLPARRRLAVSPRSRGRRPRPGLPAPDRQRGLDDDERAERLERRRQLDRVDGRDRRLVSQGLPPARPRQAAGLGRALRVGQLPLDRVAQRQADRPQLGRLPAVRAAPAAQRDQAQRHQPARHPRRQPPPAGRLPAVGHDRRGRPGRRLVELRRAAARGLPRARRRASTSATSSCGPTCRAARAPRPSASRSPCATTPTGRGRSAPARSSATARCGSAPRGSRRAACARSPGARGSPGRACGSRAARTSTTCASASTAAGAS